MKPMRGVHSLRPARKAAYEAASYCDSDQSLSPATFGFVLRYEYVLVYTQLTLAPTNNHVMKP